MSEDIDSKARRLREARAAAGFQKATDAATAMDIPSPTYLAHENGSRGYGANASRYAAKFNVNLEWLLTGKGAMRRSLSAMADPGATANDLPSAAVPPPDAAFPQTMPRDVRVEGIAACGPDGAFTFESGTIDYVRRPPRLAGIRDTYALYTTGESMSPWREQGQLVYVAPKQPVFIGDHVVVQVRSDEHATEAYIKKLIKRTGTEIRLLQYNPRKEIRIPLARVVSLHKILEWSELLGV